MEWTEMGNSGSKRPPKHSTGFTEIGTFSAKYALRTWLWLFENWREGNAEVGPCAQIYKPICSLKYYTGG
jgi:hypothetical protein